jgi:phosphohistidine phosphatase
VTVPFSYEAITMDLILWRHADAEEGSPDMARKLTPKGAKQARQTAAWLRPRLPKRTRIISSSAERAKQTTAALTEDFEVVDEIGPGASCATVLRAAGWPDASDAVLLVGHQPTLGALAAFLLAGEERPWSIKKSGIWWLSNRQRGEEEQIVLRAVIAPDLL